MSRVRQLPQLYLRGSLVQETAKNLTPDEKKQVEEIVQKLFHHPALQRHRHKIVQQLANTISGDYQNNQAADQECLVALWRAVVQLFFHCDYSFRCTNCEASEYRTTGGLMRPISSRLLICPNCRHSTLLPDGTPILNSDYLVLVTKRTGLSRESCIQAIRGARKYETPEKILEDDDQVAKFFGEYLWNYFRQILKENQIKTHKRRKLNLEGPADILAAKAISQLLKTAKVKHTFCETDPAKEGYFSIACNLFTAPADVTLELCKILTVLHKAEVPYQIDSQGCHIADMQSSAPIISLPVTSLENVAVAGPIVSDDETQDPTDQLEAPQMETTTLEQIEHLDGVREALPISGYYRKIFDIVTGQTESYHEFVARFPNACDSRGVPHKRELAQFLGCSSTEVKSCYKVIGTHLLATGTY